MSHGNFDPTKSRKGTALFMDTVPNRRIRANLQHLAKENARRVPCPECGIRVLPETLDIHIDGHARLRKLMES